MDDPEKEGAVNKCGCQREVSGDPEKEGAVNKCGCQREVSGDPEKEGVVNKCGCQREGNGLRKKGTHFYCGFFYLFFNNFYPVSLFLTCNPFKCL